jgi:DNA-binding MarR family transcriptional regulator
MSENGITIELSKAQVDWVVRAAGQDGGLLGLAAGMEELDFWASPAQLDDQRLSRSLLRGLMVLASFPADGAARSVKDVANELEMGASTTHRYTSTLQEVGLLERDPVSRKYRRVVSS